MNPKVVNFRLPIPGQDSVAVDNEASEAAMGQGESFDETPCPTLLIRG